MNGQQGYAWGTLFTGLLIGAAAGAIGTVMLDAKLEAEVKKLDARDRSRRQLPNERRANGAGKQPARASMFSEW